MIFRRKAAPAQANPMPVNRMTTAGINAPESKPPGKKILVVDDDPVTVQALSLKLRAIGYSVVTASDGSQALNTTRREKPDAMLLDVNFPPDVAHGGGVPWNGFLIAEWLQHLEDVKHTPVILISASDRADYKKRASDVGATAFLPKPIDSEALLTSLETAFIRKADSASAKGSQSKAGDRSSEQPSRSSGTGSTAVSEKHCARSSAVDFCL
jgi:CheY-like chemotaxis protein